MRDWISIKDGQPQVGQNVLAVGTWYGEINGAGEEGYMGVGVWRGEYVAIDADTYSTDIIDITHWMRLPEHP